jgi:hypothetical protein
MVFLNTPQFPDVLNALNVQPHNIFLRFDNVDYAPELQTAETVCGWSRSLSWNGTSQNKTLCEEEQGRIYKCI